jgi:hypothetical protein
MLATRHTITSIIGSDFLINGHRTYEGRVHEGRRIEGLLLNSRMVQAIFDDLNPKTRPLWDYPDGPWDPERNSRQFVAAMPAWRKHGLLGFTSNLQGGSPYGYSEGKPQPWINSAFDEAGGLRADYLSRLARVLDKADDLGMVSILRLFYYSQDQILADESAILRACDTITDWLVGQGYANVLIEINNQADVADLGVGQYYHHDILLSGRVHELIRRVQQRSDGRVGNPHRRLLAGTRFWALPPDSVIGVSDFILLHGNNFTPPDEIRGLVDRCRARPAYAGQPIVFNEDDHTDFDAGDNHLLAAISRCTSWGFFDYRRKGGEFSAGFQSMPTSCAIDTDRKRAFFETIRRMSGN